MKNIAFRQKIKASLIVWLLISVKIGFAATLPTWVSNLPLWQWYAIPNTALSSVAPSPQPCGATGPQSKIVAWNGATLKRDGSVYMLGAAGGHADYCGNEVDALALNTATPQWVQLSPPSPDSMVINESQFFLDKKPAPTHTFYGTQFINARNRMIIPNSPGMLMPGLPSAPSGWPYAGYQGYSFSFNLTTNSWDAPEYVAMFTGGGDYTAALVAKHPTTEDIYYNPYGAGWWKWSQASNSWSKLSSNEGNGNYAGAAIDPKRNRMLIVGNYGGDIDPQVRDLSGNPISVSFGGMGAAALHLASYPGVVYDEVNDKFLVFANDVIGIVVYRVDAATLFVDTPSVSGTTPSARYNGIHNSVQYVPELGGVVVANDYNGNVFFMRTSSAGVSTSPSPTPSDTQAPTVPTNPSASATSSSQINLTWSASSDNVGVTGYVVYRQGTQIATTTTNSYSDTGLSASTSYSYTIAAYDAAGNQSPQSTSATATTQSGTTASPSGNNIGPSGTAYQWSANDTPLLDTNKVAAPQLNDNNLTTDLYLNGGAGETSAKYEAGGIIWPSAQTINSVTFINGTWLASNDGGYSANLSLQFTTDGTTWTNSGWAVSPAYAYNTSAVSGVTYTFTGSPVSVRGVRVSGQVRTVETGSYYVLMREVQAFTTGTTPPMGDTSAPTAPANLAASAISSSQISLNWSASSDNVGVTGYKIYRGGTQIATVSGASYQDSGLSAGTTYAYTVAAYDAAGNVSIQSVSASATTQAVAVVPPPSLGSQITSFQLTSPMGGSSLPFTIGLGFKKGDIADTPALNIPASQVIVKSRWNDGSAKMAIASGEVTLAAGTPSTITVSSSTASSGTNLTSASIQSANPQASVSLGSYGSVNLSSLLATPFRTWITGPEMVEAHYRSNVGSDPTLAVWFHVRLYKTGRIWVRAIVENGYINVNNTDKSYLPKVTIGGTTVFDNNGASLTHYANTRWTQEGWVGGDPQITPKHDTSYLISTKLVPNYWKSNPSSGALDALPQSYVPMNNAGLSVDMGGTGYQPQIGLLPLWDALYVTSGDARAYKSSLANSSALNSYPIVWRDSSTKLIPKPSDWPTATLGTYSFGAGGLVWEMNHAPSEGYLAYLITGDYWHYETMMFNSALNWLARNYDTGTGVNRILVGQTRGTAWNLRTISQACALAAQGDLVADDYKTLLTNNMTYWKSVVDGLISAGSNLGYIYEYNIAAYGNGLIAPWQDHFLIQSFGMGSDLEPLSNMSNFITVRDFTYKAIVGILGTSSGFTFTDASAYNLKVTDGTSGDPTTWYHDWHSVYTASVAAGTISADAGNTLLGTSGGDPSQASTGYWGNLLPAIAYAVDHGATGASTAWARLTGATNWSAVAGSGFDDIPIWGIVPRNSTGTPTPTPPPVTVEPPSNLRL